MIEVWRIGTDTPVYMANDMSGIGAEKDGGRWNSKGKRVVYTASTRALACLETVVHLGGSSLPLNRYLVRIEIPDDVWSARRIVAWDTAPVGWDALPTGKASLDFGDQWLSSLASCIMEVPSIVVREEPNILINPGHPDAARINASKVRKWEYDSRIIKTA